MGVGNPGKREEFHAMRSHGFTMIEITIVVGILGVLTSIVIPQFMKSLGDSRRNACIANLKQIDTAVHAYCSANNTEAVPTMSQIIADGDMGNSYMKKTPACSAGGTYAMPEDLAGTPACSLGTSRGHVMH